MSLLSIGDWVRFQPITMGRFIELEQAWK
jgi:allophanate hydrolase subunit 1